MASCVLPLLREGCSLCEDPRDLYAQESMESLGGENLGRETPIPIEKGVFTSFTGTTRLSLFFQTDANRGRCRLLAGEVAVG